MKTCLKTGFISLLCMLGCSFLVAQPSWTQENYRNLKFPAKTYLTGFSVAKNTLNEAGDEFMNKQVAVARTELINSIYTNLQSISSLNIENKNTQTNEVYRLKTASFSKASLSGLKVEKYYDSANKTAYAFAYASKTEVADYNRRLINESKNKLETLQQRGQSFKSSANVQQALKTFYEGLTLLRNVETAQSVLLALNYDLSQLPYREEFNEFAVKLNQEIEGLQNRSDLQLNDVAYFLAYGLFLQIGKTRQTMAMEELTYENKGFKSPFSQQLKAQLKNQLIETGQYKIREEIENTPLLIKGSYWIDNDQIRIVVLAEEQADGSLLASSEAKLPLRQLEQGRVSAIPPVLQKVALLQKIRLKALNPRLVAKVNQMEQYPARVQLSANNYSNALSDIPLLFVDQSSGTVLARVRSDQNGMASAILEGVVASSKLQAVEAFVDVPAFLKLNATDPGYQKLQAEIPVEKTRFMLKVSGMTVQLEASELSAYGQRLKTPILGPRIKNELLKSGYTFTDDYSEADLYISLQATAKEGKNAFNLFFSYVDATISVMDLQSGKEVYSNTFENVKGGAGTYEQATMKAFQNIATSIIKDLKTSLK